MAHLMNELPDVKVRLRAEPADEFSARVLGALAPGAFEPDDGPVLRLPEYMAQPHKAHESLVSSGWREVLPGLQARSTALTDGAMPVDFRLTPPAGQARD